MEGCQTVKKSDKTLVILVGLPASGKSTLARQMVKSGGLDSVVVVSRDPLRDMLRSGMGKTLFDFRTEQLITELEQSAILQAFKSGKRTVILDDTNLRPKYIRQWVKFCIKNNIEVDFEILDVEPSIAFERNRKREHAIPEDALVRMVSSYTKHGKISVDPWKIYDEELRKYRGPRVEPYVADQSLPKAILVDIDGTVAHNDGTRGFYDWHLVGSDVVKENTVEVVKTLRDAGYRVIFLSGRDSSCYNATRQWLSDVAGFGSADSFDLFMRPEGDKRRDADVKLELFNNDVRNNYNVRYVFDDRDQVVALYRSLGLTVAQVEYGDF